MSLCAGFYLVPKKDVVSDTEFTEFEDEDKWSEDPREFIYFQSNWFLHKLFYELYQSKGGKNKNNDFSVVVSKGYANKIITDIITAEHTYETERQRYFDVGVMKDVIKKIKEGNIVYYSGSH